MILFERIFEGLIIQRLGVNTRYLFFKLLGNKKTKKQLMGDIGPNKLTNQVDQHFVNVIVGFISFAILSTTIVYVMFLLDLL